MSCQSVIFDLDGTIIDSNDAILASLKYAFDICNVIPSAPLEATLVGPPLQQLLSRLAPQLSADQEKLLISSFIEHYDESCAKNSKLYDGVYLQLQTLYKHGLTLAIATNKRSVPTAKILQYNKIDCLFSAVLSPDSLNHRILNKEDMIIQILDLCQMLPSSTLYIGDTEGDFAAARAACVHFGYASWGYGNLEPSAVYLSIKNPSKLVDAIYSFS
jgi:phosphoglycolate phosphatase